jgi:formate hydrogenlyase subunit 6/NADH:ubiquinone oxidoreductase subunit I
VGLIAVACPAEAITMEAAERRPGEEIVPGRKSMPPYEINMLRCIFCGLCEEACPKDAIYLSETFAPANFQRKGFIYGKEDLLILINAGSGGIREALGNRSADANNRDKLSPCRQPTANCKEKNECYANIVLVPECTYALLRHHGDHQPQSCA